MRLCKTSKNRKRSNYQFFFVSTLLNINYKQQISSNMTKKFVKADLKTFLKKEDQPAPATKSTNDSFKQHKNRSSNPYQQRMQTTELRKYFQPLPPDEVVQELVKRFPTFFTDMILHPQPLKVYKGNNESSSNNYRLIEKPTIDLETIPDWESQGEVQLGVKISPEIIAKVQNIAPINLCELKQYQKEFLEEEVRRKMEENQDYAQPQKTILKNQQKKSEPKKFESDSEEEVVIKKVIINQPAEIQTHNFEPQFVVDDDEDDGKFKDSSQGSDDDIFGSGSDKSTKQKEEEKTQQKKQQVSHGQIKCAKGQFSMFALSQGISEDELMWTFSSQNGQKMSGRLSSKQMDRDYVNLHYVEYPFLCFGPISNNFVPYNIFHSTPDIKFFKTFNKTFNYAYNKSNSNNYKQKKDFNNYQSKNSGRERKFSGQQDVVEERGEPTRYRKYSNNYRPKKQQQRV